MVAPRQVLMVAYHFPPMRGSSGVQRTLKFAQYLPQSGWQPLVLSAHRRAYDNPGDDQLADIPAGVPVRRAFALDSGRHLAVRGRYAGFLALPDRWVSWCLGAIPAGLALARRHRPQVIWSTYPIATAHLIGLALHKLTGLPWVADMRDPMTDLDYPSDRLTRRLYLWIERRAVHHCARLVCTTPGAVADYARRFPHIPPERFCLIENAYDEENFSAAEAHAAPARAAGAPFVLIHSGVIYPSERDPLPLLEALAELRRRQLLAPAGFQLLLRATGHDAYLRALIEERGLADLVTLAPHLPYQAALAEMLAADGLLILQAANCNRQVPAKLYEYLRARRPILALTDTAGDTAATLRKAGIDSIAPLDNKEDIMQALLDFLALAARGAAPLASAATIRAQSRQARALELAALLDEVVRQAQGGRP